MPIVKDKNYKIVKIEKGPLQRFKNSNLLMKKFGEMGLQIYRVITGKRTSEDLRKDLDIEPEAFAAIVNYMEDAGMIELTPVGAEKIEEVEKKEEIIEQVEEKKEEVIEPEKEEPKILEPEKEEFKIEPPEEEEIKIEAPEEEEKKEEVIEPEKEEPKILEPEKEEFKIEPPEEDEIKIEAPEEEEKKEEIIEAEEKEETLEPEKEETIDLASMTEEGLGDVGSEEAGEEEGLNTVEKMIKDKFGDVGVKVYALIDGSRTTDEIMKETGVTETRLVEILNFLEDRGIIKMEGKEKEKGEPTEKLVSDTGIADVMGPDTDVTGQDPKGFPTIDVPVRLGLDILKTLKLKADILFKYADKGSRTLDSVDGKIDTLDISLKTNLPLFTTLDILNFSLQSGALIMKPLTRLDVKRKYGDPGFSVYKKYGREGVMLYELIDKNLTIKQMAEKITKDKDKFLDMFLFIRKVLNIEIPIDKEVLMRQLT